MITPQFAYLALVVGAFAVFVVTMATVAWYSRSGSDN